jgi:hypothetical protein
MATADDPKKKLKGFEIHGVHFSGPSGEENFVGDCCFCSKRGKFYANFSNKLWFCHGCDRRGNYFGFLSKVAERNRKVLVRKSGRVYRKKLSRERGGLPWKAFKLFSIGYDGIKYTIPIIKTGTKDKLTGLLHYTPGGKLQVTAGCTTELLGAERYDWGKIRTVYVCEGEWDAIALTWLLTVLGYLDDGDVAVLGLPGAMTFKKEWVSYFERKRVFLIYDNDGAGEQGELKAKKLLSSIAREIKYLNWPDHLPVNFDLGDWICKLAIKDGKLMSCWRQLKRLFKKTPRLIDPSDIVEEVDDEDVEPISREELVAIYMKWLKLDNEDPLAILYATIFANRLEGEPLWILLVGPPGGTKSVLLMSLSGSSEIYSCSSFTPHTLISGARNDGGKDPSLIPRLDGKILTVKDLTVILQMHPMARDDIFGQLRDAYDGNTKKEFGTGLIREYWSKFGIIAGVTPAIDSYPSFSDLGERFLKFRIHKDIKESDEFDIIRRAMSNEGLEGKQSEELYDAAKRFCARKMPERESKDFPTISQKHSDRIIKLAMTVARLRGSVVWEKYDGTLKSRPTHELGTRLSKQLVKLAIGLAFYYGNNEIGEMELRLVSQVAFASIPDKVEEVIRVLHQNNGHMITTSELARATTSFNKITCARTLTDLHLLKVVKKREAISGNRWALAGSMKRLIKGSEAFEELDRRGKDLKKHGRTKIRIAGK